MTEQVDSMVYWKKRIIPASFKSAWKAFRIPSMSCIPVFHSVAEVLVATKLFSAATPHFAPSMSAKGTNDSSISVAESFLFLCSSLVQIKDSDLYTRGQRAAFPPHEHAICDIPGHVPGHHSELKSFDSNIPRDLCHPHQHQRCHASIASLLYHIPLFPRHSSTRLSPSLSIYQ